jgi:hypothetical protein
LKATHSRGEWLLAPFEMIRHQDDDAFRMRLRLRHSRQTRNNQVCRHYVMWYHDACDTRTLHIEWRDRADCLLEAFGVSKLSLESVDGAGVWDHREQRARYKQRLRTEERSSAHPFDPSEDSLAHAA